MIDERQVFERVMRGFVPPDDSLERLGQRRDRKRRNQRIAAGVVGITVFVAAVWVVTSVGSFDRTQPAVTGPTPTKPPASTTPKGVRLTRTVEGATFSLRADRSWTSGPITKLSDGSFREGRLLISKSIVGPQGAEAVIFWTDVSGSPRAEPCGYWPDAPVSSSAVAAAVATARGTELVGGPTDVTVGGLHAKRVVVTTRWETTCDPGFFFRWRSECWGPCWTEMSMGSEIQVWIVDVEGTRLFFEAATTPEADSDLKQEIQQIIGSIRFLDTPTPGVSGSTGPSDTLVSAPKIDYVIDLNTGAMTPLPEAITRSIGDSVFEDQYAVSPDGSQLAYVGMSGDEPQIFIANIDGTGVRQVTHDPNGAWSPAWSPDGTMIAYEGLDSGHVLGLFVLDVASGESIPITGANSSYARVGDRSPLPEQPMEPQFTPDGSSLVYTASTEGRPAILTVPVAGGTSTLLIGAAGKLHDAQNGSLSPDGSLVTFLGRQIDAPGLQRWVANADGTERRLLPDVYGIPCMSTPTGAWSADGSRIVCSEASKVIVIDIATGAATPVAYGRGAIWLDDHTLLVSV